MKKLTKVLSLIIAVTMIFGMTLTSFAAADPAEVVAMGFNPNETSFDKGVEIVADPLNADEKAVKFPKAGANRFCFGVAGEPGATLILEDKALYTVSFDVYYFVEVAEADDTAELDKVSLDFYRGSELAGKGYGNKTDMKVNTQVTSANEWQHCEMAFFADLTKAAEHKYLLFSIYEDDTQVLVKNFSIAKVGAYDENGYIEIDPETVPATCYIGDKLDLKDMKVTYTDSEGNSNVITHGYTAVYDNSEEGICELAVTLGTLTTSLDLEVIAPSAVLSDESLTLQLNESYKLTATTDPEALGVVWSSSDADVIEVTADGTVIAKNYGEAEVIATVACNGKQYTAVCAVSVPKPVVADDEAQAIVDDAFVFPGDTFTVNVALKNIEGAKSIGIENIIFNAEALELVDVKWLIAADVADWDAETSKGAVTFADATDVNGDVLAITFTAKDITYIKSTVGCEVIVDGDLVLPVTFGTVTVKAADRADLDQDRAVTAQDAVYLMYYTLYGAEDYALNQDADFDGSRNITSDDAVYLLYYVLFGAEEYPLPDLDDDGMNINPGNPEDPDDGFGDWEPIL